MLAQVTLTPTESKRFIAKAIASMDYVKRAAVEGMVVLQPSSSTYFIVEELTGKKPDTNYWVCGVITPRGTCTEMGAMVGEYFPKGKNVHPGEFRNWWVIQNNNLYVGEKIVDIVKKAKPSDVFIKGVNALDMEGNVGILVGDPFIGGPVGYILSAWNKINFYLIFPAGLEKLIPIPIKIAAKLAKQAKYDYAMGLSVGLLPCPHGNNVAVVTEIEAVRILSGTKSVPVASGGLGGAEGAITMVISGTKKNVKKAIDLIEKCKGSKLPQLRLSNCKECPSRHCKFPVTNKHWIT